MNPDTLNLQGRFLRILAGVSVVGFAWFLVAACAVQAQHMHHAAETPISAYLKGPGSIWLQSAYYILALALALALALLGVRILKLRTRMHVLPGVMLWVAACAVFLVAYTYTQWPLPGNPTWAGRLEIHITSAFFAFLAVTVAMFIESALLWRGRARSALFVFAFATLALEIAAGIAPNYADGIYGLLEKLSIAFLVFWLILCAVKLQMRGAESGSGHRRSSRGPRTP